VRLILAANEPAGGIDFDLPQSEGLPVLAAGTGQETIASVPGLTGLRWSIIGRNHGAVLRASPDGTSALIRGGTETGLLTIQAESNAGAYRGELELAARAAGEEASLNAGSNRELRDLGSEDDQEVGALDLRRALFGLLALLAVAILSALESFSNRGAFGRQPRSNEAVRPPGANSHSGTNAR
jgi:hypothetical protein